MDDAAHASGWPALRLASPSLWRRITIAVAIATLLVLTLLLPGHNETLGIGL